MCDWILLRDEERGLENSRVVVHPTHASRVREAMYSTTARPEKDTDERSTCTEEWCNRIGAGLLPCFEGVLEAGDVPVEGEFR
jgi:hypothetical protein